MTTKAQPHPPELWLGSPLERLIAAGERLVETASDSLFTDDQERSWLRAMVDHVPDYLFVKDSESRFILANDAVAIDHGYSNSRELVGKTDFDLHTQEKAQAYFAVEQEIIRSGRPRIDMEEAVPGIGGTMKWVLTSKLPLRNKHGGVVGLVGVARDITERKRSDALRAGHARLLEMIAAGDPLEEVLDNLLREVESHIDGVLGSVLLLDASGEHLTLVAAPSLPQAYSKMIDGLKIGPSAGSCGSAAFLRKSVIVEDILTNPLWDNYRHIATPYELRSCWSTPVLARDKAVLGTLAFYSKQARRPNVTELQLIDMATHIAAIAIGRKRSDDRIRFMAHHDALTGLPNRALLDDCVSQAIQRARRDDRWVTLAFIDLDGFKAINDDLGHNAGDHLLKVIAMRLMSCLLATDTAVRLGGDEFLILLANQPKDKEASIAAILRIQAALAPAVEIQGRRIEASCSIGVANYPNDGDDPETLLARADMAMYDAKRSGGNKFRIYSRSEAGVDCRPREL